MRAICLALPEAEERETWDAPTFRVRDRIFAMMRAQDGQAEVWMKARPGAQAMLIEAAPARFFCPPYVGPKGWIGMRLDDGTDWEEVRHFARASASVSSPHASWGDWWSRGEGEAEWHRGWRRAVGLAILGRL